MYRQRKMLRPIFGSKTQLEESFYSKKFRENLLEEDALTSEEEGFMYGYEQGGRV